MKQRLKQRCKENITPERLVNGTDSRVVLGSWAKGRSSSSQLNGVYRSCLGWLVLGQKTLSQFWVPSKENPSDDPSRLAPLRPPDASARSRVEALLRPERTLSSKGESGTHSERAMAKEVFAGCAGLSQALGRAGLGVDTPLEAYPAKNKYVPAHDVENPHVYANLRRQIRSGCFFYIHFGLPCKSWSQLQRMNGGTRRKSTPAGDGSNPHEERANILARRIALLCRDQHKCGNYFSVENPRGSYLWDFESIAALGRISYEVDFDQCMYGLLPPHLTDESKTYIRKSTRLLTNMVELKSLSKACDHCHKHYTCLGSVRVRGQTIQVSAAAGRYPSRLCRAWAASVAEAAGRRLHRRAVPREGP